MAGGTADFGGKKGHVEAAVLLHPRGNRGDEKKIVAGDLAQPRKQGVGAEVTLITEIIQGESAKRRATGRKPNLQKWYFKFEQRIKKQLTEEMPQGAMSF